MRLNKYVADFETTTDPLDCRVWGWGISDIECKTFEYGNNIKTFFDNLIKKSKNISVYFHNLRFDGQFILSYLLNMGFQYSECRKLNNGEMQSLITDGGLFYSIKLCYKGQLITFLDSLKLMPMSVKQMAETFKLKIKKGEIDYHEYRAKDHKLTLEEIDYLRNDVQIVCKALKFFLDKNLNKMTIGSNALQDFKAGLKMDFDKIFPKPTLEIDAKLRKSYKGGFTYCQPKYQGKMVGDGITLDVNSLYPYVMKEKMLPYGEPKHYFGQYEKDARYPIYIQTISCSFELKDGFIPTIQLKNNFKFMQTEYLKSSNFEEVELNLTSVDLKLFLDHYHVYNLEYVEGYKFKQSNKIISEYIEKWNSVKEQASKDKNEGLRTLAKLMNNNIYGKFGTSTRNWVKIPYLDENGVVRYINQQKEEKEPVYIALASFVTSYARDITIRSAQTNYDRFLYADTDSLHLLGHEVPDLDVDPHKLGSWKIEYKFNKGKFLRAKAYIENVCIDNNEYDSLKIENKRNYSKNKKTGMYEKFHVCCAGLPHDKQKELNFEKFRNNYTIHDKKASKIVKGGCVLIDTEYTFKI